MIIAVYNNKGLIDIVDRVIHYSRYDTYYIKYKKKLLFVDIAKHPYSLCLGRKVVMVEGSADINKKLNKR